MSTQLPYSNSARPAYLPTQGRARILIILLIANAALAFLSGITVALGLIFQLPEADLGESPEPFAVLVALLVLGVGVMQILVYLATIVVFLMWLYRAHQNLPAFGVPRHTIQHSSAWAVGSFFIPFVSLVVPYQAIKDLWNKSVPGNTQMFSALSPPAFFPLWWGVWLISNFIANIHWQLQLRSEITLDTSYTIGLVSSVVDIAAAILALTVVREIEKQQFESSKFISAEYAQSSAPPSPPRFDQVPPAQA